MADTEEDLADLIGRLGLGGDAMSAKDYLSLPGEEVIEQQLTDEELVAAVSAAVADAAEDEVVAMEVLDGEGEEDEEEEEEETQAPPSLHAARHAAATLAAFVGAQGHLFTPLSWDVEMGMVDVMSLLNKACVASLRNLRQADIRAFFAAPTAAGAALQAEPMAEESAAAE